MKKIYIVLMIIFICGCDDKKNDLISSSELGFRDDLLSENFNIDDINWSKEPAGMSQKYARSYENAPPLIPHDLDGLLPITKDLNMCITCHMPEIAQSVGAVAMPKSHLVDLRTNTDLNGELEAARYNCDQCHVPQANVDPIVANKFEAAFRKRQSMQSSNLFEIINEGVKE